MKKIRKLNLYLSFFLLFLIPFSNVAAQNYHFEITRYDVQAIIESDGSLTLYYEMDFKNGSGAHPIDFVDLGLPNRNYQLSNITASIDGRPISKISHSAYVQGAELALGENQIPAGSTGTLTASVTGITGVLFPYDQADRENYVNFQFSPNYFDSDFDNSRNTDYTFSIVLPPGVGANDGVYYYPQGWPGEKEAHASLTIDNNLVIYDWNSNKADTHSIYTFGVAFPDSAIPESSISLIPTDADSDNYYPSTPSFLTRILHFLPSLSCIIPVLIFIFAIFIGKGLQSNTLNTRKLAYLPPSLSIEGHGIKRGLTAVEAAILLQEPLDKVLTMILFGLLKKEAITVTRQDPLMITPTVPMPVTLYEYETDFIDAFVKDDRESQRAKLQNMMVSLVRSVENKMKGFNSTETKAYYTDIINRAWMAVENAKTPEIRSAQFDHTLEWTMLDKNFSGRTTRSFMDEPVFLPRWWARYNPVYSTPNIRTGGNVPSAPGPSMVGPSPKPGMTNTSPSPSFSLPNLPGAAFAASIIDGGANMAKSVIGDPTTFTSSVTSRTNPIPVSTSSSGGRMSGGGGSSCACACACAGCACACAGGGR